MVASEPADARGPGKQILSGPRLFFLGGDIGKIGVNGTVNDLAMCGARCSAIYAAWGQWRLRKAGTWCG